MSDEIELYPIRRYAEVCSPGDQEDLQRAFRAEQPRFPLTNRRYRLQESAILSCQPPLRSELEPTGDSFFLGRAARDFHFDYPFPERWLHVLPQARLIGPAWAVLSFDHQLIQDSYHNPQLLGPQLMHQQLRINLGQGLQDLPFSLCPLPSGSVATTGGCGSLSPPLLLAFQLPSLAD